MQVISFTKAKNWEVVSPRTFKGRMERLNCYDFTAGTQGEEGGGLTPTNGQLFDIPSREISRDFHGALLCELDLHRGWTETPACSWEIREELQRRVWTPGETDRVGRRRSLFGGGKNFSVPHRGFDNRPFPCSDRRVVTPGVKLVGGGEGEKKRVQNNGKRGEI